ncbi:MAG: tRNA-dihydrouridine synthase family protein [Calditrichaeota bacterium]|nr:MAG: tRNA-dihydrouridine synthase family protein [Calditrichota bacterium]
MNKLSSKNPPEITLAPMDGVIEFYMRDLLTATGGYDLCVTEFLRVSKESAPARMYQHICPELKTGSLTSNGTPVFLQLLGGEPQAFIKHAERACELGAMGIDINFGCPAKRVNQHKAGAFLLQEPEKVYQITKATRQAVPDEIPVSAKIRLGYENTDQTLEIAEAIAAAGATWLTVHARTAKQAYRPPVQWEWIAAVKKKSAIPVIANGDIWDIEDYRNCLEMTGCDGVMLGRGALIQPDLALQIKAYKNGDIRTPINWDYFPKFILQLVQNMTEGGAEKYILPRVKQYVSLLRLRHEFAHLLFNRIKRLSSVDALTAILEKSDDLQEMAV